MAHLCAVCWLTTVIYVSYLHAIGGVSNIIQHLDTCFYHIVQNLNENVGKKLTEILFRYDISLLFQWCFTVFHGLLIYVDRWRIILIPTSAALCYSALRMENILFDGGFNEISYTVGICFRSWREEK